MDDTAKIWIVDDEPSVRFPIYTRGNAGEVFPNVVTPLTGSLFAQASVTAQTALFLELGFVVPRDLEAGVAPLTGVFGGYLYLNLSVGRLAGARSPGLTPDTIDTQLYGTFGAPPYRRQRGDRNLVATARILRGLVRTLRHPDVGYVDDVMREAVRWVAALPEPAASSDRALLDLVPTFPARIEQLFVALLRASTMSGTGRGIAEELLKRGGGGVQLVNRLTSGLGTIDSALPAQRLWDLGRLVAADEGLTAAFDDGVAGVGERIGGLGSDAANDVRARVRVVPRRSRPSGTRRVRVRLSDVGDATRDRVRRRRSPPPRPARTFTTSRPGTPGDRARVGARGGVALGRPSAPAGAATRSRGCPHRCRGTRAGEGRVRPRALRDAGGARRVGGARPGARRSNRSP